MKLIAITTERHYQGEAQGIEQVLRCGAYRVHLRKPTGSAQEMRTLIEEIDPQYHPRLVLHDHHALAQEYSLGGVHLNQRNPDAPTTTDELLSLSRSCHSLEELTHEDGRYYAYSFLSPIYDSISKAGYRAAFDTATLHAAAADHQITSRTVALGGITSEAIPTLQQLGFGGIAMIGALWGTYPTDTDLAALGERTSSIAQQAKTPLSTATFRLQLITQSTPYYDDISGTRAALEGGCRWVQLRMKDATRDEIIATAKQLKPLCERYGALLLVDDHVEIARALNLDGVHLGQSDMPIDQARSMLGEGFVIGGTANTFEHLATHRANGADYVGVGPFRYTTTKKNLSPTLGLEGYRTIIQACDTAGIRLPIVAIGGITPDDVAQLMQQGIAGIAASGTILHTTDAAAASRAILKSITSIEI